MTAAPTIGSLAYVVLVFIGIIGTQPAAGQNPGNEPLLILVFDALARRERNDG
ncbi:MAG TPA: hypothetical protein VF814_17430 [Casimicrobiaceae bacterium]